MVRIPFGLTARHKLYSPFAFKGAKALIHRVRLFAPKRIALNPLGDLIIDNVCHINHPLFATGAWEEYQKSYITNIFNSVNHFLGPRY